jgi:hypothetical protein
MLSDSDASAGGMYDTRCATRNCNCRSASNGFKQWISASSAIRKPSDRQRRRRTSILYLPKTEGWSACQSDDKDSFNLLLFRMMKCDPFGSPVLRSAPRK